jgi:hypothetical protein
MFVYPYHVNGSNIALYHPIYILQCDNKYAERKSHQSYNGAKYNTKTHREESVRLVESVNRDEADLVLADVGHNLIDSKCMPKNINNHHYQSNSSHHIPKPLSVHQWQRVERLRSKHNDRNNMMNHLDARSLIIWGVHCSLSSLEVMKKLTNLKKAEYIMKINW